jgi:hypothetical protein
MPVTQAKKKKKTTKKTEENSKPAIPPFSIVIHGMPGVGKTSLAAFAPDPYFISDAQERGCSDLQAYGLVYEGIQNITVNTWQETLDAVMASRMEDYQTLVIDSLTGIEKYCFQHVCKRDFQGKWTDDGFYSYQQGPKKAAKREWPELIDALVALRSIGRNVILIAHSQVKTHRDPKHGEWERWIPYLDKETWQVTYRWAEAVLFADFSLDVRFEGGKSKPKVTGGQDRYLHTKYDAAYDAKNRWHIPDLISMGSKGREAWDNLESAMREAIQINSVL